MAVGPRGGPRGAGAGTRDMTSGWREGDVRWMGGNGEAVSGLPAPPLVISGIGEGGSEQPQRLTRVLGTGPNTTVPRMLKVGSSGPKNTRPPLDRGWQRIDGWRAL